MSEPADWMDEVRAEFKTVLPRDYLTASIGDFTKEVRAKVDEASRGILIMGPVGTGKTHLAAALHNLKDPIPAVYREPAREVMFASAQTWLDALRAEFDGRSVRDLPSRDGEIISDRAKDAAWLAIDDYGRGSPTEWAKEQLLGILDSRCNEHRPTVVTTNLDWDALQAVDERFFDRLRFFECIILTGTSLRKTT